MADADDEDLGTLLLSVLEEVKALNLKVETLRQLLQQHVGVTEAQYDAMHAKVIENVQALLPDGRTQH